MLKRFFKFWSKDTLEDELIVNNSTGGCCADDVEDDDEGACKSTNPDDMNKKEM